MAAGAVDDEARRGPARSAKDSTAPDGKTALVPERRNVSKPLPETVAVLASRSKTTAVCSSTPMISWPGGSSASSDVSRSSPR